MDAKITLPESDLPRSWYNILADAPTPPQPPLHPGTGQPVGPGRPGAAVPDGPDPPGGLDRSRDPDPGGGAGRPAAVAADAASPRPPAGAAIGTRSRIYYKYEGGSPAGSHKPNTAVAQAYYSAKAGRKRLATETGAGQWGSALALASQVFGLECKVYMVRVSYDQKPYRRVMMETWGASVVPSPSPDTNAGRAVLEQDADSPGSLGIAISEAVEDAAGRDDTSYSLGSVLNHVLLHQTVIGQEAQRQLALAGEKGVDVVIGCVGGGSNFGGLALPFVRDKIAGAEIDIVACEPAACPTLTRGPYAYDFGDTGQPDAARPHAHARPRLRAARRSTRAACATTAPRRSSRSSSSTAWSGPRRSARPTSSPPRSSSPGARRSSRRPRARTPSRARSTPPAAPTRPGPSR